MLPPTSFPGIRREVNVTHWTSVSRAAWGRGGRGELGTGHPPHPPETRVWLQPARPRDTQELINALEENIGDVSQYIRPPSLGGGTGTARSPPRGGGRTPLEIGSLVGARPGETGGRGWPPVIWVLEGYTGCRDAYDPWDPELGLEVGLPGHRLLSLVEWPDCREA